MRILVLDDDKETLEVVQRALEREGHNVVAVRTPEDATQSLDRATFDLLVLDVMLDGASGLEFCAQLRADGLEAPILFLSARGAVNARIDGLDAGGDDYLPKPFALKELVARVRALGRRGPSVRAMVLTIGELTLEFDARRATVHGEDLPVTQREWDILRVLADARGRIVPFDVLLERVWGDASESARASLEVILSRFRKKVERVTTQPVIRTVRGAGYALEMKP